MALSRTIYQPGTHCKWTGRVDNPDDPDSYRWHQVIQKIDLNKLDLKSFNPKKKNYGIIGFECDEGVRRNLGRVGAAHGPIYLRQELSNLAWDTQSNASIFDCGNILCQNNELQVSQYELSKAVILILESGLIPIVLGGGHEVAFGHFIGIKSFGQTNNINSIGIVNFDAHFDLRPYTPDNGSSGTMFRQLADICSIDNFPFNYYCVGIQGYANTKNLFNTADSLGVRYEMAKNITFSSINEVKSRLEEFIRAQEKIYLTICADVFSSAYAPGVSAPQPFGLNPDIALELIKHVASTGKVIGFDLAEVSPRFDEDKRTAKLGAILIYALVNTIGAAK